MFTTSWHFFLKETAFFKRKDNCGNQCTVNKCAASDVKCAKVVHFVIYITRVFQDKWILLFRSTPNALPLCELGILPIVLNLKHKVFTTHIKIRSNRSSKGGLYRTTEVWVGRKLGPRGKKTLALLLLFNYR